MIFFLKRPTAITRQGLNREFRSHASGLQCEEQREVKSECEWEWGKRRRAVLKCSLNKAIFPSLPREEEEDGGEEDLAVAKPIPAQSASQSTLHINLDKS